MLREPDIRLLAKGSGSAQGMVDAVDDAIADAASAQQLHAAVCEAIHRSGGFLAAALVSFPSGATWGTFQAAAGLHAAALADTRICIDTRRPEGRGIAGIAFRSGSPCVSHNYCEDARTQPWHETAWKIGIHACAALPIHIEGKVFAVLLVGANRSNAFRDGGMAPLEQAAGKLGRALAQLKVDSEAAGLAHNPRAYLGSEYRVIAETLEDAYYEIDLSGNLMFANRALPDMLGYTLDELMSANSRSFLPLRVAPAVHAAFDEVYRTGVSKRSQDWEQLRKDGSTVHIEGSVQLVRGVDGVPVGFRGILRDVTARRKIERELRDSEMRFRALTDLSSDWYWEQDAQYRYTRMESRHRNAASTQALFLGKRPWETDLEILTEGGWVEHRAALASTQSFRDVVMYRQLGGKPYYISVSGAPMVDASGAVTGYRGVSREITDQRLAEQRIRHLATHDSLTNLPNRARFSELLQSALVLGQRCNYKFALLFLDLDRFKFINDTLGHDAGDRLLQLIAGRLQRAVRDNDEVARLGGDEFVVLVREAGSVERMRAIAAELLATVSRPLILEEQEYNLTCSMGIAMYPAHGEDEQTLMKHADMAMYQAKSGGKNDFRFYSGEIGGFRERLLLEANLRYALANNEMSVHYQPKTSLSDGRVNGVEALLRWNSPVLGSIEPVEFIPLAEELGLIVNLGKWVLRTACAQNMEWQRLGFPPMRMAVNLSVRQFGDEHLLHDIAAVLAETGMPPELLELEITEGMVIDDTNRVLALLSAIKKMGVRLAIDDFGTGYSSLGQLKNFPLDTLKVDRSFINDLPDSEGARAIAQATIAMGKAMKLTVVAEGVETEAQADFLRLHLCDDMQGHFFSKALSAEAMTGLLLRQAA